MAVGRVLHWTRGEGGLFLGSCGLDAKLALHSGLLADVRVGRHDCCLARSLSCSIVSRY